MQINVLATSASGAEVADETLGAFRLIQHMAEYVAQADLAVIIEHRNRIDQDIDGIAREKFPALIGSLTRPFDRFAC